MLKNDPSFRRVGAGSSGPLGSASYWLSRDHLLVVEIAGYMERYKRFLYSDIQAIAVQRTRTGMVWSAALLCLLLGCLAAILLVLLVGASGDMLLWVYIFAGLAVLLAGGLLLNVRAGPTCVCRIRTAVQIATLPHVKRWRRAERLVSELRPLVMSAQSGTTPGGTPETGSASGEGG